LGANDGKAGAGGQGRHLEAVARARQSRQRRCCVVAKQDGTTAGAEGEKFALPAIESMDYFVKGVTGSTK
jgi:hypothetical protein